jgi:hypothetical protein
MGSDNPRFNISAPAGDTDGRGSRALAQERSTVGVLEPSEKVSLAVPRRWYSRLASPLWLALLLAVVIRIWLTVRTHGTLDGDEALLGIQAEHILQGARPIYFYGIPYFGSLEAYLVALLFAVFGPSVAALRAETIAISLALVAATWWLATLFAKAAGLPPYARRWFVTVAALAAALPPLYDGIVLLRTGGGWIESFVLMILLIISVFRLTTRWHEKASGREQALRWVGIGFIVGFGMWIYPLVSVSILAAALWIFLDRLAEAMRLVRAGAAVPDALVRSLRPLCLLPVAIPACVIGFTPGVVWGISHQWQNIHYIFGLGGGLTLHRLTTVARVTEHYAGCVAPRIIGGATPNESLLLTALHAPLVVIGVAGTVGSIGLVAASFKWPVPLLVGVRQLAGLPAIFGICSALLFCLSSASTSILVSCRDDFGGRYAAPLVIVLPFFLATAVVLVRIFIGQARPPSPPRPSAYEGGNGYGTGNGLSGRLPAIGLVALCVFLIAYFGGQATTYGLTNPDLAFQSPWCTIAPANYGPIISYMEKQHIQYAWATNLLAYPISFLSDSQIVMADPIALIPRQPVINRIPAYTNDVKAADRPSLLVFVKHNDPYPPLLQQLDQLGITYTKAYFPSQTGVDVLIVTPLNRTVAPFASPGIAGSFYCSDTGTPSSGT